MEQVRHALDALYSSSNSENRVEAGRFLERFQKSFEAWNIAHELLAAKVTSLEHKVFAAQTLRSKILFDLKELPEATQYGLRDGLFKILIDNQQGPRILITQLCLCLACLAAQVTAWNNAVGNMVDAFGQDESGWRILLTFIALLPDEIADAKKAGLTEEEIADRSEMILSRNAQQVLNLLVNYLQSPMKNGSHQRLVLEACSGWLREWQLSELINSSVVVFAFSALSSDDLADAAAEFLTCIFRDTCDIDESLPFINQLYPKLISMRTKIRESRDELELFRSLTRVFCEAAEAWHVLIARMPTEFKPLVEAIAECAVCDTEREVVKYTFNFWYDLRQMLTLPKFGQARTILKDVYVRLVETMMDLLRYPPGDDDLFDGDREAEDKFRTFRHDMGDVLKDCCAVAGAEKCLALAFDRLHAAMNGQTWQDIEAPLFAMRAMAREVDSEEKNVLPRIMEFLVRLPEQPKVRYAATLVLGRYTEWTSKHPEYLEFQLNYIIKGFEVDDPHVAAAAAQALKHFCEDCAPFLQGHVAQLHSFYEKVVGDLDLDSRYEVTDGIAHIIAKQPLDKVADSLRLFGEPIAARILSYTQNAQSTNVQRQVADEIELLTRFAQTVNPFVPLSETHPCIAFWQSLWPMFSTILQRMGNVPFVAERLSKCLRSILHSYRQHNLPLLPSMAEALVIYFSKTSNGCFLWVSGAVVQIFGDSDYTDSGTREATWKFCEQQCIVMFRLLDGAEPHDIPDDFFRFTNDLCIFFPLELLSSQLIAPSFSAALTCLSIELEAPLLAVLHFLRDVLGFGSNRPASPMYAAIPPQVLQNIIALVRSEGSHIMARLYSGLIYTFPADCIVDASGLLMSLVELCPEESLEWTRITLGMLPAGTITEEERHKFVGNFQDTLSKKDTKKIRSLVQDFTAWYRRRNVTPRSSSTRLPALAEANFSYTH